MAQLEDLVMLVRGDMPKMGRKTVGALIVIEVHARDTVQRLIDAEVNTCNDFDWVAQLRFYWERRDVYKNPTKCQDPPADGPSSPTNTLLFCALVCAAPTLNATGQPRSLHSSGKSY